MGGAVCLGEGLIRRSGRTKHKYFLFTLHGLLDQQWVSLDLCQHFSWCKSKEAKGAYHLPLDGYHPSYLWHSPGLPPFWSFMLTPWLFFCPVLLPHWLTFIGGPLPYTGPPWLLQWSSISVWNDTLMKHLSQQQEKSSATRTLTLAVVTTLKIGLYVLG